MFGLGMSYDISKSAYIGIRWTMHLLGKTTFKSKSDNAIMKHISATRKGMQNQLMVTVGYRFGQN